MYTKNKIIYLKHDIYLNIKLIEIKLNVEKYL
jgi:hypothetical protein